MGNTSKDLLGLEHKNPSASTIESALLVCNGKKLQSESKKPNPDEKPIFSSVPKSQVLGKARDFLGVISEANKRLELDAKDKAEDYNIEVLKGDDCEVIEMDLMLGVADLHTPEAVAAAESAILGNQPVISLAASGSGTESEDSSDDSEDDGDDDDSEDELKAFSTVKHKKGTSDDASSSEVSEKKRSKKRTKIIELL